MGQDSVMKRFITCLVLGLMGLSFLTILSGCGKKEKSRNEYAVGNWMQYRNRAYILLITNPKGEWSSSVRIADATSKIVKSKGNAKGTWYIENDQIIFTVMESDIEQIWKKNSTSFFKIVELTENMMTLENDAGRIIDWKQTQGKHAEESEINMAPVVSMGPVVVNLNKIRSNDKDRYLCLNLDLILKELMPDQKRPTIHPRVREATIIFLSSLVFKDVKDFESIKEQNKKLVDIINPYMENVVKDVDIQHVIVATEIERVEEFMIEHTLSGKPEPENPEEDSTDKKG